mmetsp:Transcript_57999/g.169561  ORF Transcript_57999/g.169561 Transcript_57999/m.169561 type:complete len:240 (-) Transcript_57999:189-908(-)
MQLQPLLLLLGGRHEAGAHHLEGQPVREELEHHAAHAPDVALRPAAAHPHFGSHRSRCPSNSFAAHAKDSSAAYFSNAEIADNDMRHGLKQVPIVIILGCLQEQDVLAFQVLVHHTLGVEVDQGFKGLSYGCSQPYLRHIIALSTTGSDNLEQLAALAVLHDDVDGVAVLVPGEDAEDVRVVEVPQQLRLHLELVVVPPFRPHNRLHDPALSGCSLLHFVNHAIRPLPNQLACVEIEVI